MEKEKLKIALISLQKDAERVPPVGLVYLATYLRDILGINNSNLVILDSNYSDIETELESFSPHILGFTSMTVEYGKVIEFAKKIKSKHNIPFILGGVHISTLPLSLNKVFDIGVVGEGEKTFAELIKLYLKKNLFITKDLQKIEGLIFFDKNKLKTTPMREPIKDLDELPLPDFKFVNKNYFRKEEIPSISYIGTKCYLISSRGCPYRCVFCSTSHFWGKIRFHSPDYTAKIIKKFMDDFGSDYIKVLDDLFTISPQRLRDLKISFEKYGILEKIKAIECQPRANLMNDELCIAMKELKIKVLNFGFESGSDKMLKWLKKESVTVEMNKNAILLCKKYGFYAYGSLIYGSPGETIEDMEKTNEFIDFAIKNKARYMWSFIATPFPNTLFWEIALKRGKVTNGMDWNVLSHHNLDNPLLLDENIDKEEFKRVFLKGRKKLTKLKIRLIKEFIIKNPIKASKMVVTEPFYYFPRIIKQVFKQ